ncbi:MAG: pentapeptide repeat-containing protein [Pseudomonadota bacterium]
MFRSVIFGKISTVYIYVSGAIALAADLGTPWADLLGTLCIGSLVVALLFIVLAHTCRLSQARSGPVFRVREMSGNVAACALVALLVTAPFWALQKLFGGENGLIAEHVPAAIQIQEYLDPRFDRIERAFAVLTESVEDQTTAVGELEESVERQTEATEAQTRAVNEIQETMSFSVAMEVMERARARRDGSNQGQAIAMQTLLASGFDFIGSDYSGVSFRGVGMDGANFTESRLHFIDLRGVSAKGALFASSGLRLGIANKESVFDGANFSGAYAPLFEAPGASFQGADLSGANLYGADLRGADLRGANLRGASFVFADLTGAELTGADLSGAHFVGAVLKGATLNEAIFDETNMLGAALDPRELSASQRAGTCRHQASVRDSRMTMTERWESDRFGSGYEYDDINEYDDWVPAGPVEDVSLRVCKSPVESAVGFNAAYPLQERFTLDRYYLGSAGRERRAVERFDAMRARLKTGRKNAVFFTDDGSYRAEWVATMQRAAQKVTPIGPPYVDQDFMLAFMIGRGVLSSDNVNWREAMEQRIRFEREIRTKWDGEFAKFNHWGPFFPEDVKRGDIPEEAETLFREWTERRAATLGDEIVIRPGTTVLDKEGRTMLNLSTNLSRVLPGVGSPSYSWPSHRLADEAKEAAGGEGRLEFSRANLQRHGLPKLLYVYSQKIDTLVAKADTTIPDLRERAPDLDLTLRVGEIRNLGDSRRGVTLMFVEPVSAVVHTDGPLGSRASFALQIEQK